MRTPEQQLAYRQNKHAEHQKRWATMQDVLGGWGELRNNQSYQSGQMGKLTAEQSTAVDDRLTNVLCRIEQKGLPTAHYWTAYDAGTFPQLDYELLMQYSIITEFRARMWRESYMESARHADRTHFSNAYVIPFRECVLSFKHACRMLRRYRKVPRDTIRTWLPTGFVLY